MRVGIASLSLLLPLITSAGCSPEPIPAPSGGDSYSSSDGAAPGSVNDLEWTTYRDASLAFSVRLPEPIRQQFTRQDQTEALIVTSDHGALGQWECIGALLLTDRPEVADSQMLEDAMQGALRKTDGRLVDEPLPMSLSGYLGRQYTIELPSGEHAVQRVYLARPRVFILTVTGDSDRIASAAIARFFDSLEIQPLDPSASGR